MRVAPAGGGAGFPYLRDMVVTNSRANQENPIEHSDETIGNCAEHEYMKRSHAVFQQREPQFGNNIR